MYILGLFGLRKPYTVQINVEDEFITRSCVCKLINRALTN